MSTAWFRLSGNFDRFKWVGQDLSLTSRPPVSATIQIIATTVTGPTGELVPAAKVESSYQTGVSERFLSGFRNVDAGTGAIYFHYFPVVPNNVQAELTTIREALASATVDVLNLVRWAAGEMGPSDPLTDVDFSCSLDGETWRGIGPAHLYRFSRFQVHSNDEPWLGELQGQIDEGIKEPIARGLLREAWSSHASNPRAALVSGVAALEVGTKNCIARLVPESMWLVDNVPSPPVHTILSRYLPQLLNNRGNLTTFAPTKGSLKQVQEAVGNRNVLVHRFAPTEKYEKAERALGYLELEKTLLMVEEFLDLFDLYTGTAGALDRLRSETRNEMIDRNGSQDLSELDCGEGSLSAWLHS